MNALQKLMTVRLRPAKWFARILPLLLALAFSQARVQAHHLPPGFEEIDEFEHSHAMLAGLKHPLTGWDHCLALLVIGCAATLVARKPGLLPAMFFSGLAVGGALGSAGLALPQMSFLAMAALIMAAGAIAIRKRTTFYLLAALTAAFGLCQGNSHALMLVLPQAMAGYAFGFVISSAALMLAGGLLGLGLRRLSPRMAQTV